MTQSWPQRPSGNTELVTLLTRAMPAGLATIAVGVALLVALDSVGLSAVGMALLVASVVGSWFVSVRVWAAANLAVEQTLPQMRIEDGVIVLPTDVGETRIRLTEATVQSGWYDRRPTSRSLGAWLHLADGTHRVTVACVEDAFPAQQAGIERVPGGGPKADGHVRVHARDIGPIWKAMQTGGAEQIPFVPEG